MESDQITQDEGAEATALPVVDETSTKSQPEVEKPLTKAEVQAMLDKKERQWQSVSERQRKALSTEAKNYRKRAESVESQLAVINEVAAKDPALAARMRAATTAAQARAYQEQERVYSQEQEKQSFFDDMSSVIREEFGVDPEDKRIDMAFDAKTQQEATRRILASVSKIRKEDSKKETESLKEEIARELRKELGIDSVDTTSSSGGGASDSDFLVKFGEGDLPYTKENLERASKLMNK
uniref:Uncharacterized protein n=1 Tax=viral metagenome TaxID=1070528 RepID=A0A6M3IGB2_9ZZZZ